MNFEQSRALASRTSAATWGSSTPRRARAISDATSSISGSPIPAVVTAAVPRRSPLVAVIAVAVCAGFLPHNFSPARIFMGDAGAMFLGVLMAVTTITIGGRTADEFSGQTYFFFAPLVIPILILAVPVVDTAFSFVRRVVARRSFLVADREHLHHRLMRLGHGPRRAVVILWLWTALLSAVALIPTYTNRGNALVPLALGGLALLLFTYFHPGFWARSSEAPEASRWPRKKAGGEHEVVDLEERRRPAGHAR